MKFADALSFEHRIPQICGSLMISMQKQWNEALGPVQDWPERDDCQWSGIATSMVIQSRLTRSILLIRSHRKKKNLIHYQCDGNTHNANMKYKSQCGLRLEIEDLRGAVVIVLSRAW